MNSVWENRGNVTNFHSTTLQVLSKQSLGELQSEFPEDINCICHNLRTQFEIGTDQKEGAKDEENLDKEKLLTKVRILESSKFRKEQQFNFLCKAARQSNLESVVLLARQGADLNQTDYDGRTAMVTRVFAAGDIAIRAQGLGCRLWGLLLRCLMSLT